MAWTIADVAPNQSGCVALLTISELVATGSNSTKTLNWPADIATLIPAQTTGPSNIVAGRALEILGVRVVFTTVAGGGSRSLQLKITSSSTNVVDQAVSDLTQAASQTSVIYQFITLFPPPAAAPVTSGTFNRVALPSRFILMPGQKLDVTQTTVVDATDTCVVHLRGRVL